MAPSALVELSAEMRDRGGRRWRSRVLVESSPDGIVDVFRQSPVEGPYQRADPMGLIWSMSADTGHLFRATQEADPPGAHRGVGPGAAASSSPATLGRYRSKVPKHGRSGVPNPVGGRHRRS
jgi:hypothetical protein